MAGFEHTAVATVDHDQSPRPEIPVEAEPVAAGHRRELLALLGPLGQRLGGITELDESRQHPFSADLVR